MELTGKIIKILDKKEGKSQKGKWTNQTFVIENKEKEFTNIYAFEVFNNKVDIPEIGKEITVHFNIRTNEYQEKYYTSLTCWKIETKIEVSQEMKDQVTEIIDENLKDLPF